MKRNVTQETKNLSKLQFVIILLNEKHTQVVNGVVQIHTSQRFFKFFPNFRIDFFHRSSNKICNIASVVVPRVKSIQYSTRRVVFCMETINQILNKPEIHGISSKTIRVQATSKIVHNNLWCNWERISNKVEEHLRTLRAMHYQNCVDRRFWAQTNQKKQTRSPYFAYWEIFLSHLSLFI